MPSLMDRLIDAAALTCTICGKRAGTCDCWEECRCGWSFPRGMKCRNPKHVREEAAQQLADGLVLDLMIYLKEHYPEPLRYASGGFRKSLQGHLTMKAKQYFMSVFEAQDGVSPPPEEDQDDDAVQSD